MRLSFLFGFLLFLPMAGCDTTETAVVDSGRTQNEVMIDPFMTASIGGSAWVANTATVVDVRIDGDLFLRIRGEAILGDAITLLLVRPIELKTYVIRGENLAAQQYRAPGSPSSEFFESFDTGTVTFSFVSEKRLEGFFSFDADRYTDSTSVTVKGGRFRVGF